MEIDTDYLEYKNRKVFKLAKASLNLAVALFLIEGLAMVTRFKAIPVELPFRLLACHLAITIVFFVLGIGLHYLMRLPVPVCIATIPAFMILLSGDRTFYTVPAMVGTVILLLVPVNSLKFFGSPSEMRFRTSIGIAVLAALPAKGSLLEKGGWLNVAIAAIWLICVLYFLGVESRHWETSKKLLLDRGIAVISGIFFLAILTWGILFPDARVDLPDRVPGTGPNVAIIMIDTVRPEGLSGFEGQNPPMLNLANFAADHFSINRMIAPSPSSLPSHATLFTGLPSSIHGAHKPSPDDPDPPVYAYSLDKDALTLAERLSAAGYLTIAISGNYGPLHPRFGLNQGFDYYDAERNWAYRAAEKTLLHRCLPIRRLCETLPFPVLGYDSSTPYRHAGQITDKALSILKRLKAREPFFLFINLFDVHSPYLPPDYWRIRCGNPGSAWINDGEPIPARQVQLLNGEKDLTDSEAGFLRELFSSEMRFVDQHIQRILETLDSDNTLIIIVADHGESLGEHGLLKHSNTLFREEVEVPCIVSFPGPGIDPELVSGITGFAELHDLVLKYTGLTIPVRPEAPGAVSEVFSAKHPVELNSSRLIFTGDLKSLSRDPWKLIWQSGGRHQLFNMKDAGELLDVADVHPEIASEMAKELDTYLSSFTDQPGQTGLKDISAGELDALRTLGYIE
ncbi:sulfatase [bacterium]|nr:sulfatase [candidate division CSSED10-310 bacterium]